MWFLIVFLVLLLIWLGIGFAAFCILCLRKRGYDPSTRENVENGSHGAYAAPILAGQAWIESQNPQVVETESFDGLRLVGRYLPCRYPRGVAILFHGYRSRWNLDFSCSMEFYHKLGFSLLAVDQRSHGDSEGAWITYGVRERQDVLAWVNYVNQMLGPDTPILIGGLSMGATTVQMACGLELPGNVHAVISDCGFTSPYEIIRHVLEWQKRPVWLFLPQISLFCRLLAGFGLREYSTLTAQRKNRIPTFFAHGEDDDLVPCEMSRRNYRACRAEKHLLTVPGATHGDSYLVDRQKYEREITSFLRTYFP